jgi:hypothetical protein
MMPTSTARPEHVQVPTRVASPAQPGLWQGKVPTTAICAVSAAIALSLLLMFVQHLRNSLAGGDG